MIIIAWNIFFVKRRRSIGPTQLMITQLMPSFIDVGKSFEIEGKIFI
jgi:hypothetical protein